VSLQRLDQFLLERETERLESTMAMAGSDYGGNGNARYGTSSPRVVMQEAAFGPVAGAG